MCISFQKIYEPFFMNVENLLSKQIILIEKLTLNSIPVTHLTTFLQ